MTVELVLLRHGETDWNVERRWQGQGGEGLNVRGRAQAAAAAQRLASEFRDRGRLRLITSDLQRSVQTATIVGRALRLAAREEPRLREIDVGRWSGQTHADAAAIDPRAVDPWRRPADTAFGGGESVNDVRARVESLLDDLVVQGPGTVIAVTHGGVIRIGTAAVLGMPVLEPLQGCANASFSRWRYADERSWRLEAYNSTDHLAGIGVEVSAPARNSAA